MKETVMPKGSRLDYLDIAKGIGILLVIIGHCLADADNLDIWIYSFHMPLFFILSGWLFSYKKPSVSMAAYVSKKCKTLLFPYFVFTILTILWKYLLYFMLGSQTEGGFDALLWRSITTYGYHSLWFLPCLFWVEVISYRIELCQKQSLKEILYVLICMIGFCIFKYCQTEEILKYVARYTGRVCVGIMFYKIGMLLSVPMRNMKQSPKLLLGVASFIFSISLCWHNGFVNMSIGQVGCELLYILLGISGSIAVIVLSQHCGKPKLLMSMGRNSLLLMCLHMDFGDEIAYMIMAQLGLTYYFSSPILKSIIAIIISMFLMEGASFMINRYFPFLLNAERIRTDKLLHRIKKM